MIEIFMLYDGRDTLSLCNDIKTLIPTLELTRVKHLLSGEGTISVTEAQLLSLTKLEKIYGTFAVGKA